MFKSHRYSRLGLGLGGLMACLSLAACGHGGAEDSANAIHFSVWAVPESASVAKVQVRLAPKAPIAAAVLEASSTSSAISLAPAHFKLANLEPAKPVDTKAHNPPALGMTLIRTFTVHATQPGRYPVTVRLSHGGHSEVRTITVDFTGH